MKRYPGIYAKVGTVPMFIYLRSRRPRVVGELIEFRMGDAHKWERGKVTNLEPLRLDRF